MLINKIKRKMHITLFGFYKSSEMIRKFIKCRNLTINIYRIVNKRGIKLN